MEIKRKMYPLCHNNANKNKTTTTTRRLHRKAVSGNESKKPTKNCVPKFMYSSSTNNSNNRIDEAPQKKPSFGYHESEMKNELPRRIVSTYGGEPAIYFEESVIATNAEKFKFCLIGKFPCSRPSLAKTRDWMSREWNLKGEWSVTLLDARHVFLRLPDEGDMLRIWMRRRWFVGGHLMRIFRWTPEFHPSGGEPCSSPVWIQLPFLPVVFYQEELLIPIASMVGRVLTIDGSTRNLSQISAARICVEVDLSRELPQRLRIGTRGGSDGFWQDICYEKLPSYCLNCRQQGHSTGLCRFNMCKVVKGDSLDKAKNSALHNQFAEIHQTVKKDNLGDKMLEENERDEVIADSQMEEVEVWYANALKLEKIQAMECMTEETSPVTTKSSPAYEVNHVNSFVLKFSSNSEIDGQSQKACTDNWMDEVEIERANSGKREKYQAMVCTPEACFPVTTQSLSAYEATHINSGELKFSSNQKLDGHFQEECARNQMEEAEIQCTDSEELDEGQSMECTSEADFHVIAQSSSVFEVNQTDSVELKFSSNWKMDRHFQEDYVDNQMEEEEIHHMNSRKHEKDQAMEFTKEAAFPIITQSSSAHEMTQTNSIELKFSSNGKMHVHSQEGHIENSIQEAEIQHANSGKLEKVQAAEIMMEAGFPLITQSSSAHEVTRVDSIELKFSSNREMGTHAPVDPTDSWLKEAETQHTNSKKLEKDQTMECTTVASFHIITQSSSAQEVAQIGSLGLKCSSNCKMNGHSREECWTSSTSSRNYHEYGKGHHSSKVLFHPPFSEGNHSKATNRSSRDNHKIKSSEYNAAESSTRVASLPNAESMQPVSHYFRRADRRPHMSNVIPFIQEVEGNGQLGQLTKKPRNQPVKDRNETSFVNYDSEIRTYSVTRWANKSISLLGVSECMPVLKKKDQQVEDVGQLTKNPRNHAVKGKTETGSINNDSEIRTDSVTWLASNSMSLLGGPECMPVLKKKGQLFQQEMDEKPEEQQGVKQCCSRKEQGVKQLGVKIPAWKKLPEKLMFFAKTRTERRQITEMPREYKYSAIKTMTASFTHRIGQGGFSDVFKGVLPDGRPVAVKVMKESRQGGEEFINEIKCTGRAEHINIIDLLGFCFEGPNRVLIYEYMPSGSLEKLIYEKTLGSEELYQIAIGIARGLEHLHFNKSRHILHLDIKPHNILLDENMCPKISDFGLSEVWTMGEGTISVSLIRGTYGYMAPEYCMQGLISYKSDVYSYGMMILEMVGGRKNLDPGAENSREVYYQQWVYEHPSSLEDRGEGRSSVSLVDETKRKMMLVGLWCIQMNPVERPSMRRVVQMLEGNIECLQMPTNPRLGSSFRNFSVPAPIQKVLWI